METAQGVGRTIGVLLLVQMTASLVANFVLQGPVFGAPGFLVNAAAHPTAMGLSALLGIAAGLLSVGIAIVAFPVLRRINPTLMLWFLALSVVGLSISVVENINVMSLLSLSEAYAKASAAERSFFPSLRVVVASARNWAHYLELIVSGSTLLVLYTALYRYALVPRALAAFGLAAVSSQLTAVALPLFGHDVVFLMLAPLGMCQLVLAVWLIAKGWRVHACPNHERSDA
jgi:hypothetical protein